jgi:hypothetical protein
MSSSSSSSLEALDNPWDLQPRRVVAQRLQENVGQQEEQQQEEMPQQVGNKNVT